MDNVRFFRFLGRALMCHFLGRTTQRNAGKKLTCVWCRADWIGGGGTAGAGVEAQVGAGGYLNLSQAAGLSPQRDTSSCNLTSTFPTSSS